MGALCGGDLTIFPLLARAMIREGIIWGEFWTAEEDGELVGFMTWTPPGVEPNIPRDERAKVNAEFVEALSEEGKAYSRTAVREDFHNFVAQCVGEKGKDGGWWLRVAMVRPDKQGQGIARKLFEPMRRKAAERDEHIACTTTTLRNVEIYKALGFEHRGSHTFPCKWGDWSLYALYMKP
ncbi:uncharacterized protein TRAVEDRAFT_120871 [Trametes versicolor FP-101664 SS1]|uniref:uncharacterized protein n=1 Tax=Trametes versicolor (strain FP-101664) TaxID=717944 RepID=UPI000462269B|nr:uncharacterized protein TRAVEDRAFT_120871 [Trametes versicolor FP-101664 SS1]EIW60849.1 hypothetical protein TRAVEDRAFT_120871 [Trametes versicolor FP-101664 SS1]